MGVDEVSEAPTTVLSRDIRLLRNGSEQETTTKQSREETATRREARAPCPRALAGLFLGKAVLKAISMTIASLGALAHPSSRPGPGAYG